MALSVHTPRHTYVYPLGSYRELSVRGLALVMLTIPVPHRCPKGSLSILASFWHWWDRSLLSSCLSTCHCSPLHRSQGCTEKWGVFNPCTGTCSQFFILSHISCGPPVVPSVGKEHVVINNFPAPKQTCSFQSHLARAQNYTATRFLPSSEPLIF